MLGKKLIKAAAGNAAAEETDENFNQTVLLLHGDGTNGAQNNTFLDSSTNGFTITRNPASSPNAPTQGTFSPFSAPNGRWSNYFDGTGDYLQATIPALTDFTIEGFVYTTVFPGAKGIFTIGQENQTSGMGLVHTSGGALQLYGSNGSLTINGSLTTQNEWHYFAVTRSGSTVTLYWDSTTPVDTDTWSTTASTALRIGVENFNGTLTGHWNGYIANIRISDVARTISSIPTSLGDDSDTVFLGCAANRFADLSTNAATITVNGNPKVTPFSPFAPTAAYNPAVNGGSGYFDGTGDYLSIADNTAFEFGSGDFCVELFAYINAFGTFGQNWAAQWNTPNRGWIMGYVNSGTLFGFSYSTTGSNEVTTSSSVTLPLNQWNHLVACRSGNTLSTYLNGVRNATRDVTGVTIFAPSQALEIGRNAENSTGWNTNGYISNLRIVKGSSPYDATQTTLTVPTAPLTAITNTSVLLNYTNAGIFDNTCKNVLETIDNSSINTTTKKYGTGSISFDGNADRLVILNQYAQFSFGTGDFTIEAWVYLNSMPSGNGYPASYWLVGGGPINVNTGFDIAVGSTNLQIGLTNFAALNINVAHGMTTGIWYHIAVVRSGNTLYAFKDGTQLTTADVTGVSADPCLTGLAVSSGEPFGATSGNWNGFIDELRITKGVARYTTTFTPPEAEFLNR